MIKTKLVTLGGISAGLATLFQLFPVIFSEAFVFITILSTFPVYFVARINPRSGLLTFAATALLVTIVNIHEGIFFLCTNGILGLCLGICSYYKRNRLLTCFINALVLSTTLSLLSFIIGIPVFGMKTPMPFGIQLSIIFLFSFVYSFLLMNITDLVYRVIYRVYILAKNN